MKVTIDQLSKLLEGKDWVQEMRTVRFDLSQGIGWSDKGGDSNAINLRKRLELENCNDQLLICTHRLLTKMLHALAGPVIRDDDNAGAPNENAQTLAVDDSCVADCVDMAKELSELLTCIASTLRGDMPFASFDRPWTSESLQHAIWHERVYPMAYRFARESGLHADGEDPGTEATHGAFGESRPEGWPHSIPGYPRTECPWEGSHGELMWPPARKSSRLPRAGASR